jgi:hypothetical protein
MVTSANSVGSLSRGPTGDVFGGDLSPTETSQGRGTRGVTVLTCDHPKAPWLGNGSCRRAAHGAPADRSHLGACGRTVARTQNPWQQSRDGVGHDPCGGLAVPCGVWAVPYGVWAVPYGVWAVPYGVWPSLTGFGPSLTGFWPSLTGGLADPCKGLADPCRGLADPCGGFGRSLRGFGRSLRGFG